MYLFITNWIIIVSLSMSLLSLLSRERRDIYLYVCVSDNKLYHTPILVVPLGMLLTQRGFIFYFTDLALILFSKLTPY